MSSARRSGEGSPDLRQHPEGGSPDDSPTDGQYNDSSNRENHILVVDYRIDERVTDRLQSFDLMTIGE